jgi:hypothetical protein
MVNRSVTWANWDEELLGLELQDLKESGFDVKEFDDLLAGTDRDDEANAAPPLPDNPVSRPGDLWLLLMPVTSTIKRLPPNTEEAVWRA